MLVQESPELEGKLCSAIRSCLYSEGTPAACGDWKGDLITRILFYSKISNRNLSHYYSVLVDGLSLTYRLRSDLHIYMYCIML